MFDDHNICYKLCETANPRYYHKKTCKMTTRSTEATTAKTKAKSETHSHSGTRVSFVKSIRKNTRHQKFQNS